MPRVSILLPNLNQRAFLEERLATIEAQTLGDWELIVSDNYSDDGAWEFLQRAATLDSRIRVEQAPREGMYQNWNRCIDRATAEYVYIATSDDTMAPTFLSEMVAALDAHPECDLAQCCLHAIDERGATISGWWRLVGAARFLSGDYLRPHVRRAPFDGVVHCAMHTQYHSITQVLIRRRAFDKAGLFPTRYGSGGDFCWGMKAGLHCDVVHVPQFLATWRVHRAQASHGHTENAVERARMVAMVDEALATRIPGSAAARLPAAPLRFPYRYDYFRHAYAEARGAKARIAVLGRLLAQPSVAWRAAQLALAGQRRAFDKRAYARALLRKFGLEQHLVLLGGAVAPVPA